MGIIAAASCCLIRQQPYSVMLLTRLASLDSSGISLALDATFPFREGIGKDKNLPAPPEPSLKGKVPNEVRRKS